MSFIEAYDPHSRREFLELVSYARDCARQNQPLSGEMGSRLNHLLDWTTAVRWLGVHCNFYVSREIFREAYRGGRVTHDLAKALELLAGEESTRVLGPSIELEIT